MCVIHPLPRWCILSCILNSLPPSQKSTQPENPIPAHSPCSPPLGSPLLPGRLMVLGTHLSPPRACPCRVVATLFHSFGALERPERLAPLPLGPALSRLPSPPAPILPLSPLSQPPGSPAISEGARSRALGNIRPLPEGTSLRSLPLEGQV